MSTVEILNAQKSFGQKKIIDGINLSIPEGKFFCLLGPSGCGKTTLLRLIAGLEHLDAGKIVIAGEVVDEVSEFVPPQKRQLGMVFQSYALWPHMTVAQNILYPLKVRKVDLSEQQKVLKEMTALVQLSGLENRYPHELSGGQQQRVALARALSFHPRLVLMDEPLSNLDASLRRELKVELKNLQKSLGMTVIYVTHDQEEAVYLSDELAVLDQGKLCYQGPATGGAWKL